MPSTPKKPKGFTERNKVQLLRSGSPYFDRLLHIIHLARHTIHLQVYIFSEDETGKLVANALMQATKKGVTVYLMPDGYASQDLSSGFIKHLQEAGVQFRFFEPLLRSEHFYFGRRLHHKVTVVDCRYSLVTGINISNRYNDMPKQPAWMDWALYAEGEVSAKLDAVCTQLWNKANKLEPSCRKETTGLGIPLTDKCLVRIRRNDWVKRHNQISGTYISMLRTASSHVYIMSSYFIPGLFIRLAMMRAIRKGIKIKLILTGVSDVKIAKAAELYMYRWMLKKGVEIYEYNKGVLHSKLATKDGSFATIGSYNVNNISAYASVELNLDIANEGFAKHTEAELEKIIQEDCTLITDELYNKRYRFVKKTLQMFSYFIVRIMINISTFYFKQQ